MVVTLLPAIVAGPLPPEYVTAPAEAEVATTVNGGLPKVCAAIGAKASVGVSAATLKVVVAGVAAAYPMVAAWVAVSVTLPIPVSVSVLPTTVAGPLVTAYTTGAGEAEVALTANAGSP